MGNKCLFNILLPFTGEVSKFASSHRNKRTENIKLMDDLILYIYFFFGKLETSTKVATVSPQAWPFYIQEI